MRTRQGARVGLRGAGVLTLIALLVPAVWTVAAEPIFDLSNLLAASDGAAPTHVSFAEALSALCALAACSCAGWLALVSGAVVLEALSAQPAQGRHTAWCPTTVRRLILRACGVALTAGLTSTPAVADSAGSAGTSPTIGRTVVTGLTVPDRTVDRSRVKTLDRSAAVRVRPGDNLWSLAAKALGPGATDAEIEQAWHSVHVANIQRIGPNPHLLLPGTILRLPASVTAVRATIH